MKKSSRKKPKTPSSKIRNALRRLWLQSRERSQALKRDEYTCQICGCKQSRAKGREQSVEVHHKDGCIQWDYIEQAIRAGLLVEPSELITLCPRCHDKQHPKAQEKPKVKRSA